MPTAPDIDSQLAAEFDRQEQQPQNDIAREFDRQEVAPRTASPGASDLAKEFDRQESAPVQRMPRPRLDRYQRGGSTTSGGTPLGLPGRFASPLEDLDQGEGPSVGKVARTAAMAGRTLRAGVADVASRVMGMPAENLPTVGRDIAEQGGDILQGASKAAPLPIDAQIQQAALEEKERGETPWRSAMAGAATKLTGDIPKFAALPLAGPSLLAQSIAAGGIFGMDDEGNFHPKEAIIMALLPGVGKLARLGTASLIGQAAASGIKGLENPVVQKVLEEVGHQAALDGYMALTSAPDLIQQYQQDPTKAALSLGEIMIQNLGFAVLGATRFRGGVPSDTENWLRDKAKTMADDAIKAKVSTDYTGPELKAIYQRVASDDPAATEQEKNLVAFINSQTPEKGKGKGVLSKGARITTVERDISKIPEFWKKYIPTQQPFESVEPLTKGAADASRPVGESSSVQEKPPGTVPLGETQQGSKFGNSVQGAAGQPNVPGRPGAVPGQAPTSADVGTANTQTALEKEFDKQEAPVPETPATIEAQLEMLKHGKRNVVMITPGEDMPKVPKGFNSMELPQGNFIFRPGFAGAITEAIKNNTLGDLLGYGIPAKPAPGTEVGAVVVRSPDGVEKHGVLTDASNLPAVVDAAKKVADKGDTISIEPEADVIAKRNPGKSSTQLTLPPAAAAPIVAFAKSIPDSEVYHKADANGKEDYGIETEPHITALFGLTQHSPEPVANAVAGHGPVEVTLGKLSVFENPDYDVLKVDVKSPSLRSLNEKLSKLPNEQTFEGYKPHLTIAYLKKGEGKKYVGDKRFDGQKLTFDSLTFSPPSEVRATLGRPEIPFGETITPQPATKEPVDATKVEKAGETPTVKGPDVNEPTESGGGSSGTGGAVTPAPGPTGEERPTTPADQGPGGEVQSGIRPSDEGTRPPGRRPRGGKAPADAVGIPGGQEPAAHEPGAGESGPISPTRVPEKPAPTDPASPPEVEAPPGPKNIRLESNPAPTGVVSRVNANIAALALVKKLDAEKRFPTDEERKKLAQWSGWGSFKEVFSEGRAAKREYDESWNKRYGKAYDQLRKLLTDEEFHDAAESSVNAHYTSQDGIHYMWNVARRLGFKGGRALEPSAGSGVAIGYMPGDLADKVRWTAIEMEPITGKILGYLYPEADVRVQPFENSKLPNGHYDLAFTNVPFHEVGPGKEYPEMNLHNYFIARMLDKVKPGGLVIAISTKNTMDAAPEQRAILADKGELIGAIRLPNDAFKESAGTEVVTDVLVFRKPDGKPFDAQRWLNTSPIETRDGETRINEYFVAHPDMVLGRHALTGTMYGKNEYTVEGTGPIKPKLEAAVQKFPENVVQQEPTPEEFSPELTTMEESSLVLKNGEVFEARNFKLEKPLWDSSNKTLLQRAKDYINLRDLLLEQYRLERDPGTSDADMEASRKKLAAKYKAWVKAHGTLNLNDRRTGHVASDPSYYTVMGLENVREEQDPKDPTKTVTMVYPADVLTKRVIQPDVPPDKADGAVDALGVSLSYKGTLDMDYIRQLTGLSDEQIESELIAANQAFKDPESGMLQPTSEYLTGDVRDKLAKAIFAAKESPTFERNVAALKSVIPPTVPFERIAVDITARWTPVGVLNLFAEKILGLPANSIRFVPTVEEFAVNPVETHRLSTLAQSQWSTTRMGAADLLQHALNFKRAVIMDRTNDDKYVRNETDTALANQFIDNMKAEYAKWIRSNDERLGYNYFDEKRGEYVTESLPAWDIMEREFNKKSNSFVVPDHDGSMLRLPGLSTAVRRTPHLLNGVMRAIVGGQAVFAHGVGSGKTFLFVVASHELQRIGIAKKSVLVVKKPTVGQYRMSIERAYPGSKVLIPSKKDFEAANRKKLIARIGSTRWDFIVLTHEQFKSVRPGDDLVNSFFNDQIEQLRQILRSQGEENAENAKSTRGMDPATRSVVRKIKSLKKRLDKHIGRIGQAQDVGSNWENLGIDALLVDESHNFKKMPIATQMEGEVKGIPSEFSQRAIDLLIKVRDVQRRTNGRNIFFGSGTPVSNTLAELWVQFYATNPKLIKDFGLETFDSFASTFADVVSNFELGWDNQFKNVTRMSRFKNPAGLTTLTRMGMDVKMGNKELGLDVPDMENGKPSVNVIKVTPAFDRWIQFLSVISSTWEGLDPKGRFLNSWVAIATMRAGVAAALDPRCVFPDAPDDPNSKVNTTIRHIFQEWKQGQELRTTMMVFADMYRTLNSDKLQAFVGHGNVPVAGELDLTEPTAEPAKEEAEGDEAAADPGAKDEAEFEQHAVGSFNLYHDIRSKLLKMGVPEHEIGIITEHDTDAKRETLFNKVRNGAVRILIGSTEKIGEGVDVPQRMSAQFHLDPPMQMTPAKMEQRIGRIIRQGNMFSVKNLNKPVRVNLYAQERSMDAAIYQMLETKGTMVIQALKGQYLGDSFEDPASELTMAMAEMKAAATGDTRVLEMAKLQKDVRDLNLAEGAFYRRKSELKRLIEDERRSVKADLGNVEKYKKLEAATEPIIEDKDALTVLHVATQKRYTGEKAIKEWLAKAKLAVDKTLDKDQTSVAMNLIIGDNIRVQYEARRRDVREVPFYDHVATFYLGNELKWDSARWDSSLTSIESLLQAFYAVPGNSAKRAVKNEDTALEHEKLGVAYSKQFDDTKFDKADELAQKQAQLSALEAALRPAPKVTPTQTPPAQASLATVPPKELGGAGPLPTYQARSVEELRALLPYVGLPSQAESLITEFLKMPLIEKLPAFRTLITDALDGGWQGSKLQDLVSITRGADPVTGIHEILHVAASVLPDDLRQELERMRVASLDKLIEEAKDAGKPETVAALTGIRDNPTTGGEDFLSRNYPVAIRSQLYQYSSWEEFFTHSGSARVKQIVGSTQEGFWARLKGFISDFISAIKRALKLRPNQRDLLDSILRGEFDPADPQDVADKEMQASISPEEFADLTPEEQEDVMSGEKHAGIGTQVFGETYYVKNRPRITPETVAASAGLAKQVFDASDIPVLAKAMPDDQGIVHQVWIMPAQGRDMTAEGQRLLTRLRTEIFEAATGPVPDKLASLYASIRANYRMAGASSLSEMSADVRLELFSAAQTEVSAAGVLLRSQRGAAQDLAQLGHNIDVELGRQWGESLGGDNVRVLLDEIERLTGERDAAKESAETLAKALDEALKARGRGLSKEFGSGTVIGRKIIALIKAGRGTPWNVLREIAARRGFKIPTDDELTRVKADADRLDALNTLSDQELARVGPDEDANALLREKQAVLDARILKLRHRIDVQWRRWTRPLTLRTETGRANIVDAAGEYVSANFLAKLFFPTRLLLDVGTLGIIHSPFRAGAEAIIRHQNEVAAGRRDKYDMGALWDELGAAMGEAYAGVKSSIGPTFQAGKAVLLGQEAGRNVGRLMDRVSIFDRALAKAEESKAAGRRVEAGLLKTFAFMRIGYTFAQAFHNLQGVPAIAQEARHFAVTQCRTLLGLSPAEAEVKAEWIIGDIKAEIARALTDSRLWLELTGEIPTDAQVKMAAQRLIAERQVERMRSLGLPADDFSARASDLYRTMGFTMREEGPIGGTIVKGMGLVTGLARGLAKAPLPMAPVTMPLALSMVTMTRFGNAMAVLLGRKLTFMGLGFAPGFFGVDSRNVDAKGIAHGASPFFRRPEDRTQRKLESAVFAPLEMLFAFLVISGLIRFLLKWPTDKAEKDKWDKLGWKPGQVHIPTGADTHITLSAHTGPMMPFGAGLAFGAAIRDLYDGQAKKQAKMNAEAEKLGLTPGKVPPVTSGEVMGAGASAVWHTLTSGRSMQALINSMSDHGSLNVTKTAASVIGAYIPFEPGIKELAGLSGAVLDSRTAGIWDYLMPLRSSRAAQVNMLGEPLGSDNAFQHVFQTMSGGNFPFPTSDNVADASNAYKALTSSGYRPPAINPNKAYAINGEYRTLTDSELQDYTVARGEYLRRNLEELGSDATQKQAAEAYSRANQQALSKVGVSAPARGQSKARGAAASQSGVPQAIGASGVRPTSPGLGGATSSMRPHSLSPRRALGIRHPSRVRTLGIKGGPTLRPGRGLRLGTAKVRRGLIR